MGKQSEVTGNSPEGPFPHPNMLFHYASLSVLPYSHTYLHPASLQTLEINKGDTLTFLQGGSGKIRLAIIVALAIVLFLSLS